MGVLFGIVLASAFPLLFLGIVYTFDFYHIGKFHLIVRSLSWGIFAYLAALLINVVLSPSWVAGSDFDQSLIAPLLEEPLKGLVLLFLIRRSKITFSVDGALYGFATGIGFAIAENIDYVMEAQGAAVEVALERIFSANLVHASSSAMLGMALGSSYLGRTRARWIFLGAGLVLAIGLHMFYNNMVQQGKASLVSAFAIGAVGAVFVYLVMQWGKKQAQEWIKQKLGMRDGVTPGEAALVNRLASTDALLYPVFERFGLEKTKQVERLLYLQARLGIKRKFLDRIAKNDPAHNAIETELREMRTEMLAAERAIGAYTMLFVRGLYTDEMVSVWEQVQAKIREQSGPDGNQRGSGLWSSLEERLKTHAQTRLALMENDIAGQLRRVNWFADLPDELFAALARKVRKRTLRNGETLFNKGDEGETLFIIHSGRVKIVTQDSQENEVVLNQVGAGEIIGEMALLDNEPRSAGVVALEDTALLELSREDFLEILAGQPDLALKIIRSLTSRLRHNTRYIETITNMSRRVAQGDYSFLGENRPGQPEGPKTREQDKIDRLMAEFYAMVQGVREREEELKEEVQKLELQIDEKKRRQEFEEIAGTDFFADLKNKAQILRAQRKDNQ